MMGEDEIDDQSAGSFNSKSVWARISVIAAGPVFNFILALIFAVILVAWVGYDPAVADDVIPGSAGRRSRIAEGRCHCEDES